MGFGVNEGSLPPAIVKPFVLCCYVNVVQKLRFGVFLTVVFASEPRGYRIRRFEQRYPGRWYQEGSGLD